MSASRTVYRNIARVTRTVGRKGEVKVDPIDGLPFALSAGSHVFLTPPPMRGIYETRVSSLRPLSDGWAVRFEGVDDEKTAFDIVGRTCLADESLLQGFDLRESAALGLGCFVVDEEQGMIGTVVEVRTGGIQDLLVVVDEQGHETLVPFVEQIVLGMSPDEEDTILVALPAGLYELNG